MRELKISIKKIFALVAVAALMISVGSCKKKESETTAENAPLSAGTIAPDFILRSIDGNDMRLADQRGKVVMVEFWATWCPPCKELTPRLVSLYEKYKDKGFVLLSLVSDDEGTEAVRSFVREYGMTYPVLLAGKDIMDRYDITGIPASFILDKEGRIVKRHLGNTPGLQDELASEIERLL